MPVVQCFSGGTAAANLIYACVQPGQIHLATAAGTTDVEVFPAPTGMFVPFAVQIGIPGGQT